MSGTENATIGKVSIGVEDHGILTMDIPIEGDGWGSGFGGYCLDEWNATKKRRVGSPLLSEAVLALLAVFGVHRLDQLTGLPCRVRGAKLGAPIEAVGHFTKDRWFSWRELVDRLKAEGVL